MKIDGTGRIVGTGPIKTVRGGGSGGDFNKLVETEGAGAPAAVTGTSPLSGIESLLSLQEVDEVTERRTRAKKRASNILDQLDDIRNCLLMGEMPPHQIVALQKRIAQEKVGVDDPRLTAVLEEIELRAEVELAKLEMSRGGA